MWRASNYDSFHLSSDSDDETSPFHSNKLESESDSIDFVPKTCFDSVTPTKSSDLRSLVPEKPRRAADDVIQSTGSESLLAANQLPTPAPHKSGDSRSSVPEFSLMAPPKSRDSRSSVPEFSVMVTDFGIGSSGRRSSTPKSLSILILHPNPAQWRFLVHHCRIVHRQAKLWREFVRPWFLRIPTISVYRMQCTSKQKEDSEALERQ